MPTNGPTSRPPHERTAARHLGDGVDANVALPQQGSHDAFMSTDMKVSNHSDDALRMDLYRRFESARPGCRDFSLSETAFAPTPPLIPTLLAETLKDPENRSCAWRLFETIGIDDVFSESERRALCVGLLSYVHQDRAECLMPLVEMALYAVDHRDMSLYKAVGEVARAAGLGSDIAASTVSGFCKLSSYNAVRDAALHPWVDILAASGSEPVYLQIADTLASRVRDRQPGTYDHLLRTLCQAPSQHAASALRSMVAVPYPPLADEVAKPDSLKVGLLTGTRFCLGTVAVQVALDAMAAFLRSEELGVAVATALLSPNVWIVGAFAGALCGLALVGWMWEDRRQAIELHDAVRQHLKGSDFLHFAERVYARLGECAERNPHATFLRIHMERSDVYASVIDTWKRLYPIQETR